VFAGTRGYLDGIPVDKVGEFEADLIAGLKAREPGILDAIRKDAQIKPETEKSLIGFIETLLKSFG
jgi:F-type H+-transporting ATPase subunit alpha